MSAIDVIRARQSVRDGFEQGSVSAEDIEVIVECGLRAPSSKNAQPWRIHVVANRDLLTAIADSVSSAEGIDSFVPADPRTGMPRSAYAASVVESADVLRNVPLAIFVENLGAFSGSRREVADSSREFAENVLLGFSLEIVGIGAAIENMWIAAIELGLSGVFMGDVLIAEDFIRGALNLSGDLVGVLALGRSTSLVRSPKPTMDGRVVYL